MYLKNFGRACAQVDVSSVYDNNFKKKILLAEYTAVCNLCFRYTTHAYARFIQERISKDTKTEIQWTFARLIGQSIVDLTESLAKVKRVNYAFLIQNRARVHNYNITTM